MSRSDILIHNTQNISIRIAEKEAMEALEAARYSYPAVRQNDVLCEQLKSYAKCYQELLHQKEQCITKMVRLDEIGDITRFENHKQLNTFAGIDIRRLQSGKTFFKDKINKRGNKHLRKLLFLIIQNMIKLRRYGPNHIVEYYDKLKTQPYNKCHKVASIACVNKLLKLLFYLITHNIHYDYRLTA